MKSTGFHCRNAAQTIFLVILLLGRVTGQAQTPVAALTGRVLDAKTGQPLPFATVYINNTARGTTADENGNYRLTNVPLGNQELVGSSLGYQTRRQPLRLTDSRPRPVDLTLDPTGQSLAAVTVTARHSKAWERQFRQFSRELLGNRPQARQCRITNPGVLSFQDEKGHLLAQAAEPLVIDNDALGYRLYYDLLHFDYYRNRMNFAGTARFEEHISADARQQARWQVGRQKAYQGSLQHLLASLLAGTHERAGYTVYQTPLTGEDNAGQVLPLVRTTERQYLGPDQARALFRPGDLPFERQLVSGQPLEVYYNRVYAANSPYHDSPYAYSMLLLPNKTVEVTTNGGITQGNGLDVRGYLGNDRLATLLPVDWLPEEAENLTPADIEAGRPAKPDAELDSLDAVRQRQYNRTAPIVYVQTDKGFYCTGDQLWLSAYVLDGARQLPVAGRNGVLQLEVVAPGGRVVQHQWVRLTDGRAAGNFHLADTLSAGNYRLRAYTALDQAANGPAFERWFPVYNLKRTDPSSSPSAPGGRVFSSLGITKPDRSIPDSVDVQFLPEGGRWLMGVAGRLGIKVLRSTGRGQAVSGRVVDGSGAEVARFRTNALGMGQLTFTPRPGQSYTALPDAIPGIVIRPVALPIAETDGWSLSADAVSDSSQLTVRVRATGRYQEQPVYVTLQSREQLVYRQKWQLGKGEAQFSLSTASLPPGVCRLTLWDMTGQPRAERLVFVTERTEAIQMRISLGKSRYEPRQTVGLGIQFRDADNYPVAGSWSASVTDADQLPDDTLQTGMRTYLLLTGGLRGRVESPTYYLEPDHRQELDNLLLTQGWRRLPAPQPADSTGGWTLSGHVSDSRGRPARRVAVVIQLEQAGQKMMQSINTNDAGVFRLAGLLVSDTMRVVARALEPAGATLRFDAPGSHFTTPDPPTTARDGADAWVADAQKRQTAWPSFYRDSTARQLAEVVVKAYKIPKDEDQAVLRGVADAVMVVDDTNPTYANVQLAGGLIARFPGVMGGTGSGGFRIHGFTSFGDNTPLYIVDGTYVDEQTALNISVRTISRIELLKNASAAIYGTRGANGVIVIHTRKGGENQPPERTSVAATVTGFISPGEFYVPRYETADVGTRLDRRDVLFWQPLGESGPEGLANLVFPLNDTAKRLRIVVQGISSEGIPISFVWLLPVR